MSSGSNKTYEQFNDLLWDNASNGSNTSYVSPIAWRPFEKVSDTMFPIVGYVIPCISILTLITNPLFMTILLKKDTRSPLNYVLCALALSDMVMALFFLPSHLYAGVKGKMSYIPYNWCYFFKFTLAFSKAVHASAVVLTVMLAMQRYIFYCHKLVSHKWCTNRKTIIAIIVIWTFTICCLIIALSGVKFNELPIEISRKNHTVISTCYFEFNYFVSDWDDYSRQFFFWAGLISTSFIPCIVVSVLTVKLILVMTNAEAKRRKIARETMSPVPPINDTSRTTLILVIIVALFLLVEIPKGVLWILRGIETTKQGFIGSVDPRDNFDAISDFFIVLSCLFNFFLYCVMWPRFRKALKNMFKCS